MEIPFNSPPSPPHRPQATLRFCFSGGSRAPTHICRSRWARAALKCRRAPRCRTGNASAHSSCCAEGRDSSAHPLPQRDRDRFANLKQSLPTSTYRTPPRSRTDTYKGPLLGRGVRPTLTVSGTSELQKAHGHLSTGRFDSTKKEEKHPSI